MAAPDVLFDPVVARDSGTEFESQAARFVCHKGYTLV